MKDCPPSPAPIVKGDKFSLDHCPKNNFEWEQMKNIPYASVVGSLCMLKCAPNLTLHMLLECKADTRVIYVLTTRNM